MARPQPKLIVSHQAGATAEEICEADAVYAVLFEGKPIKLRTHVPGVRYPGFKYGKTMFPEAGHAMRLARRLNQTHNTTAFTVVIMTPGRVLPLD